ncbi:MAG TPA: DUF2087 domain-containing protein [Jatrophihabitantaceae bacterium]|jgi:hypothetical protein|nr:DUF2087 domain-containing protein [Jatrophihabitantaceae bacterium]
MTSSPEEVAKVVRTYFDGEQMTAMPRAGRKRRIALEHIVQRFEPGRRYTELEVNAELRQVWPNDVAALRRYLVDAQLLDRAAGEYWRIGGPVDCG